MHQPPSQKQTRSEHAPTSGLWQRFAVCLPAFAWAVFVAGLALLFWRGTARGLAQSVDWTMVYAGTRTFWAGGDPYLFDELIQHWQAAGGPMDGPAWTGGQWTPESFHALYPPGTFALLGPMALFPWPVAKVLWCLLNTGLLAAMAWFTGRHVAAPGSGIPGTLGSGGSVDVGGRFSRLWLPGAAGVVMAFGPGHTAVMQGQTTVLAVFLALCGLVGRRVGWRVLAFGAATLLKPQLVLPLALGAVFVRGRGSLCGLEPQSPPPSLPLKGEGSGRGAVGENGRASACHSGICWQSNGWHFDWKHGAAVFVGVLGVLVVVNGVAGWVVGPGWPGRLGANLKLLEAGGYTDFRMGSEYAFQSVDGRSVGHVLTGSDLGAQAVAMLGALGVGAVATVLLAVGVWRDAKNGDATDATQPGHQPGRARAVAHFRGWVLVLVSTALWIVYHRYYDGVLLVVGVAVLGRWLRDKSWRELGWWPVAALTLGLVLWFQPWGTLVQVLVRRGVLDGDWVAGHGWGGKLCRLVLLHQANLGTLCVMVAGLGAMTKSLGRPGKVEG